MIWRTIILTFRLMLDRRIAISNKLIPVLLAVYYFSPIDIIPDIIPFIGVADDITLIILGLNFFINLAPDEILREHLDAISKHNKILGMMRDLPPIPTQKGTRKNEDTIEGKIIE
jgi:uncharacterized membrane protein YkvA (DUF1232 family)